MEQESLENKVDPQWTEISASLRGGELYVKLPLYRMGDVSIGLARVLGLEDEVPEDSREHLIGYQKFINRQLRVSLFAHHSSLFYSVPAETAALDAKHIKIVEKLDRTGKLALFRAVVEAGLRNDPNVDWIDRVGGPEK